MCTLEVKSYIDKEKEKASSNTVRHHVLITLHYIVVQLKYQWPSDDGSIARVIDSMQLNEKHLNTSFSTINQVKSAAF